MLQLRLREVALPALFFLYGGRWRPTVALRILADLEPVAGNPYVIPGGKVGGHLSSPQGLWNRVPAEAEITDVLIHTYASIGVNTGQNLSVVGKLLGHFKILTTQRYARLADDLARTANEQIGATIEATLSSQAKAEVVKMSERTNA